VRETADRRSVADAALAKRRGVLATCFGVKCSGGEWQNQHSYTVFVKEKLPRRRLRSGDLVPKYVTRDGKRWPTDVVVMPPLIEQAMTIKDGKKRSTLTAFGWRGSKAFGVSCAHGLAGFDGDPMSPAEVLGRNDGEIDWQRPGESTDLIKRKGAGTPGDFGVFDAGLISLDETDLHDAVAAAPRLRCVQPSLGLPVFGDGARSGPMAGIVRGLNLASVNGVSILADVLIEHPAGKGLTQSGDSGMLWISAAGEAVAMHIIGEDKPGKSRLSVCTAATRLEPELGIELRAL
jgi:hypothetical protein